MSSRRARRDALSVFKASLSGADPRAAVLAALRLKGGRLLLGGRTLDLNAYRRILVIGAGKAAPAMASAVEEALGSLITGGLVVTKYGHSRPLERVPIIEAGHPVPDESGLEASEALLEIALEAGRGDLVICLVSGGASALLPAPLTPVTLEDKQETTRLLLSSGATIDEINTVRKHLSRIKGGRLARAAYPATLVTLIISDVVGDDVSSIGSGLTAPDSTTFSEAFSVIERHGLIGKVPGSVVKLLNDGAAGRLPETPKPGERVLKGVLNLIVANNLKSLICSKKTARSLGYNTLLLTSGLKGNTREAALFFVSILKEIQRSGNPLRAPACVLMGGETTLNVTGDGLGGRNQEFALAASLEIDGLKGITILSAGTDGTDGPTEAAGAVVDSSTVRRALAKGIDPRAFLQRNDSYGFFRSAGGHVVTGPTGTNVMDVIAGIVT